MKIVLTKLVTAAVILLALPILSANAGGKPFPKIVPALDYSFPEGFAIGKGHTAYNGSVDGSIYKMDLRSGKGEVLVDPEDPYGPPWCFKLGMRVDPRTNYLFVAGCETGLAYVFDADNGDLIEKYQLPLPADIAASDDTLQIVNDLTITKDAVYLTDSHQPLLYRLPLSRNGGLPASADDVTTIRLPDEFIISPDDYCCGGNGIVSTPDGKILIVGNSWTSQLLRVDLSTGDMDEILVDPPLRGTAPWTGFIDGFALQGKTLYIMTPADFPNDPDFPYPPGIEPVLDDWIQVVHLDKGMFTGALVGKITDPGNLDGVASGALFGKSLYVNNARYVENPDLPPFGVNWVTKLNRHAVEPVE